MNFQLTVQASRAVIKEWFHHCGHRNIFSVRNCHSVPNKFAQVKFQDAVPSRYCHTGFRTFSLVLRSGRFKGDGRILLSPKLKPRDFSQHEAIRSFRTSSPKNAIPPPIILILSRIAKMGAIFLGRSIRNWWRNLPPEQKAIYAERAKKNWKYIYGGLGAITFGLYVYYDSHIQETPYTNRKRFLVFSSDQFDMLAKQEFKALVELYRSQIVPATIDNPAYYRVSLVANRLLQANRDLPQIHNKEWTITVVKEDNLQNAMVLPCGNIFVFTGMLNICESNDELAAILGHEMAHAVLGHGAENASFLHFMDLLLVVPVAILWAILPTDLSAAFATFIGGSLQDILFTLPYSRAMEIEADEVGLILAAKACFDIRVAPVFWAKMAYVTERGGLPQIEFLSTHPSHEHRQQQVEQALGKALDIRDEQKCPLLPPFDGKKHLEDFKRKVDRHEYERVAIRLKI